MGHFRQEENYLKYQIIFRWIYFEQSNLVVSSYVSTYTQIIQQDGSTHNNDASSDIPIQ